MYWVTNNCLSLVQTQVLKNEDIRVRLNIPKPPPVEEQPALKMTNPFTRLKDVSFIYFMWVFYECCRIVVNFVEEVELYGYCSSSIFR